MNSSIYKMEFGFDEQKIKDCNRSVEEISDKLFRLLTSMGLHRENGENVNTYFGTGTKADRDLFFSSVIFINRAEWLTPYLNKWLITTPDQGCKNMLPLLLK